MKEKRIQIYTMTHKTFEVPSDPMYIPLQVGSGMHEKLGYLCDDTGENISAQNGYYSELTGFYWIWKNIKNLDYVGTCHYRRYLINEQEQIFTRNEYLHLLQKYDVITTRRVVLNNSYHYGFAANHNIYALDVTGEVIREKFTDYYETFVELVNGPETYFGNILVTTKSLFDQYCDWLFSIFAEVQERIDMETDKDEYHRRVFGFISEFLLLVWIRVNGLSVYECKVGMIGEKVEVTIMKERIAEYFKARDIVGAKSYFLKEHAKRPDVMMEASDVTGELHLAMQIIATADAEKRRYGVSVLDKETDFKKLIQAFRKMNEAVQNNELQMDRGKADTDENSLISQVAIEVAKTILGK